MTDRSRFLKVPISKELENKLKNFCEKENISWIDFVNQAIAEKLDAAEKERIRKSVKLKEWEMDIKEKEAEERTAFFSFIC